MSTEELIKKYGEEHRHLIKDVLKFYEERCRIQGVP